MPHMGKSREREDHILTRSVRFRYDLMILVDQIPDPSSPGKWIPPPLG